MNLLSWIEETTERELAADAALLLCLAFVVLAWVLA
jgi:hypothetical protein